MVKIYQKNGYTPIKTSIFGLNWSFYGLWPMRSLVLLVKFEQLYPKNPNMPPEVLKLAILDITNGQKIAIHYKNSYFVIIICFVKMYKTQNTFG